MSDTRKAHRWLHWSLRSAGERPGGKGGVKDDLVEELREHLLRDHPGLRPTHDQVWEIVRTRAYDFEVFDPEYAEVILG